MSVAGAEEENTAKNRTLETCFVLIYLLQKSTRTVKVSFYVFQFFAKKLDIQMILQLWGCLSATNTCKHHMFSTCDFVYAAQRS